jgi:hypothetical protein
MRLRLLRLFSWSSLFILMTFAVQFDNPAQANRDLLNMNKSDYIEPQETIINGAEGIEFRTLVPEEPIRLPINEGQSIPIKLGLRITNNSSIERSFLLLPGLLNFSTTNQNQERIEHSFSALKRAGISREQYEKVLQPGESIDITETANLILHHGKIRIFYQTISGISCTFIGFKSGMYQATMNYKVFSQTISGNKKPWIKNVQAIPANLNLSEN